MNNLSQGLNKNPDFTDITYLNKGSARQKAAYALLTAHAILLKLKSFDPILVGTIPINIDIEESDLDIICCWKNKALYRSTLNDTFAKETNFNILEFVINDQETIIANFFIDDFELEIFGQAVPTTDQPAYRHMVIEQQILSEKGEDFRQEIIRLKKEGMKTEPAFGLLLGLKNNPYIELLDYYKR